MTEAAEGQAVLDPADPPADPPAGAKKEAEPKGATAKKPDPVPPTPPVKTTYLLFEEVEAIVTLPEGGELETVVWLPLGEQSASGGASALGHQFQGKAMPTPDRAFRAVPIRSTRRFHPPEPSPVPSFRESGE